MLLSKLAVAVKFDMATMLVTLLQSGIPLSTAKQVN